MVFSLADSLSTPQLEFVKDDVTFSNCLLLHHHIVMGEEQEIQRRKKELSPKLLSQICKFGDRTFGDVTEVGILLLSPSFLSIFLLFPVSYLY